MTKVCLNKLPQRFDTAVVGPDQIAVAMAAPALLRFLCSMLHFKNGPCTPEIERLLREQGIELVEE